MLDSVYVCGSRPRALTTGSVMVNAMLLRLPANSFGTGSPSRGGPVTLVLKTVFAEAICPRSHFRRARFTEVPATPIMSRDMFRI